MIPFVFRVPPSRFTRAVPVLPAPVISRRLPASVNPWFTTPVPLIVKVAGTPETTTNHVLNVPALTSGAAATAD